MKALPGLLLLLPTLALAQPELAPKVAPPPMPCYLVWLKELPLSAQLAQCDSDALAYIGAIIQRRDAIQAEHGKRSVWNTEISRLLIWREIVTADPDMSISALINTRIARINALITRSLDYEKSLLSQDMVR